jgi:hypothetical protein
MVTKNRLTPNTVASPILGTGEGKTFRDYRLLPCCVAQRSSMGEATIRSVFLKNYFLMYFPGTLAAMGFGV